MERQGEMAEKRYFTEKELAAAKEADLCDVAGNDKNYGFNIWNASITTLCSKGMIKMALHGLQA